MYYTYVSICNVLYYIYINTYYMCARVVFYMYLLSVGVYICTYYTIIEQVC